MASTELHTQTGHETNRALVVFLTMNLLAWAAVIIGGALWWFGAW